MSTRNWREKQGEEQDSFTDFYSVEKILDMKEQGGKKYYLVKWLDWDVKTCTWEAEENVNHLKSLIKDYQNSRRFDLQNNIGLKKIDKIEVGMSPYEATKYYGHVLYGDEPLSIVQIKILERNGQTQTHFQIEWTTRQDGFKPTNSLIDSKILLEHFPRFLIDFYQSKVRLIAPPVNK